MPEIAAEEIPQSAARWETFSRAARGTLQSRFAGALQGRTPICVKQRNVHAGNQWVLALLAVAFYSLVEDSRMSPDLRTTVERLVRQSAPVIQVVFKPCTKEMCVMCFR